MSTEQIETQPIAEAQPINNNAPATSSSQNLVPIIDKLIERPEIDVDKIERLLEMQERVMDRAAREAFSRDLADMQEAIPSVGKRGRTDKAAYAKFEDIMEVVRPVLHRYGFAVSFKINTSEGMMAVTGTLVHKSGHREETTMTLPFDTSGSKNQVQAVGSSVSYGKRYVLTAMLNIATHNEDDDGRASDSGMKDRAAAIAPMGREKFNTIYKQAATAIESGARTADQIIAWARTMGSLSDQQAAAIKALDTQEQEASHADS
ncbi:MAG TPA: ERF family protein [Chromatiales bacterium]|nr:ERF family protein [Chromatiales bacterium]